MIINILSMLFLKQMYMINLSLNQIMFSVDKINCFQRFNDIEHR